MHQPKKQIKPDKLDTAIEITAWGFMLISVIFSTYSYCVLPETIPVHFNIYGEINGYGNKNLFIYNPVVVMLILVLLTIISRYPHKGNYLVEINESNVEFQYRNAIRMIRILKIAFVNALFCIDIFVFLVAKGIISHVGFISYIIIFSPFVSVVYFIKKSMRGY